MKFKQMIQSAIEVKNYYREYNKKNNHSEWNSEDYAMGLVGDIGDLMKLIQGKKNLRTIENVDEKLGHELSDVLWSTIVIANEYNIDLEKEFLSTMNSLKKQIKKEIMH